MTRNKTSVPYLVFKLHFHIKVLDQEKVALISEDTQHLLIGRLYVAIAECLLLSKLTENELKKLLLSRFTQSEIDYGIVRLKEKGYLTFSYDILHPEQEAFWHDQGTPFHQLDRLNSFKISIKKFGCSDPAELVSSLNKLGANVVEENGNLDICIVDNYINSNVESLNATTKRPWLIVKPTGSVLWLGPIFVPGKWGCWNCLSRYIKENRRADIDILGAGVNSLDICSRSILPTNQSIALNFAANEVVKWIVNGESILEKNILTLDTRNFQFQFHPFKQDHECCQCFKSTSKGINLFELDSSPKEFVDDEDERACNPEETLEKIECIVSPITGIISKIKYLKVNNTHIYYTVRNLPVHKSQTASTKIRIPDIAVGKGSSKVQAKVACLAEAIERHNCTYYNQYQIRSSFDDIENNVLHPRRLLHFSEYQYANRDVLNTQRGPFNYIPKKFEDSAIIGWTPFVSLINKGTKLIPSSYCYLNYPHLNELEMCPGDSNGCASGNTKEEAINYAILELIERDAFAIWWYNQIPRPAIDLDCLGDTHILKIKSMFDQAERELHLLDITSDLGIPCFVAVSWLKNGKRIFFGSGSNLNPRRAILRAINELNQTMTRANIPKDFEIKNVPPIEKDFIKWILSEEIENHFFIKPSTFIHLNRSTHCQSNNFIDDINVYLDIFKNKNLEVLFLDMSQPNIYFHSVKIIIPGLRHFWSRLAPGRLYDVPVSLHWLESPKSEQKMNQTPYFL